MVRDAVAADIRSSRPDVRADAVRIAADCQGDWALALITAALDDPDPEVRIAAVHALGARRDPRATEPLMKTLDDPELVASAIWSLGQVGDTRLSQRMVDFLVDDRTDVRVAAARALGKVGDATAEAPLIALVEDPATGRLLRGVALEALIALGYEPAGAKRLGPGYWALGLCLIAGGVAAGATLGAIAVIPFVAGVAILAVYWLRQVLHARKGGWYVNPGTGEEVWVPVMFGGMFGGDGGGGNGGGGA